MTRGDPFPEPPSMPFPPGTVLAGKYRVERLLGEGGMGWVVVATHLQLEQRVALKFMREAHVAEAPDAVARFLREARAAARIQSEHVARVSDVGTLESGVPYLVMEYLEGHDLESVLQSKRLLPLSTAVDYAMQACEGLAEAHAAGIVHRDLKPANLFLARRSDGSVRVKLLDFGISKLTQSPGMPDAGMTSTQALMGSPLYMSPEQLRSSKNVDRRADIWSMGVILYEIFGGRSPFEAETLPEVCSRIMAVPPDTLGSIKPELPPGLDGVVMRCLEKDPQRRFPDVASLAQELAPFGPPEARTTAERIARLGRGASSQEDLAKAAQSSSSFRPAPMAPGAAQTNASFGTVGPAFPGRTSTARVALAATAGLVAAALVTVGILAVRGHDGSLPTADSVSTPAAPPPPATSSPYGTSATASVAPLEPDPVASVVTAPPHTTLAPLIRPSAMPQVPVTIVGAHSSPRPRATATTIGPTAKPASTSGFGGRN